MARTKEKRIWPVERADTLQWLSISTDVSGGCWLVGGGVLSSTCSGFSCVPSPVVALKNRRLDNRVEIKECLIPSAPGCRSTVRLCL